MQWQATQQAQENFGPFPALRADAVYLAQLRYPGVCKSDLKLSPRLAAFVLDAQRHEVWREALHLACLLECDAATFPPNIVDSAAGQEMTCPLLRFSHILENVRGFLDSAREVSNTTGKNLVDIRISVRKLKKARNARSNGPPI